MAIYLIGGLAVVAIFALLFIVEIAAWLIVISVVGFVGLVLWLLLGTDAIIVLIGLALIVTAGAWVVSLIIKIGKDRSHPFGRQIATRLQDVGILRKRVGAGIEKVLPRGWMTGDVIVVALVIYVVGGLLLAGIWGQ